MRFKRKCQTPAQANASLLLSMKFPMPFSIKSCINLFICLSFLYYISKNAPEYFIVVNGGSIYGEIQRVEKSRLLFSVRYAIICARAAVLQGGSLPHFTEDGR